MAELNGWSWTPDMRSDSQPSASGRGKASCYTRNMHWGRHSRLAQAIAVVLLLWTALDLSNESLCALEGEAGQSILTTEKAAVAATSSAADPVHAPQHVDDCFCCSHCVEVSSTTPAPVGLSINQDAVALVPSAPYTFGAPLYHPPLA